MNRRFTQTNQPAATLKQVDVADLAAASPGSPQAGVLLARWYNPPLHDRWSTTAPLPGQRCIVQAGGPRDIWRRWFCCPGCRRRCRCLYGTNTLRCRKCLELMYASQSDRSGLSALRRADAIRCCLGEIDPAFPPKPLHL
jgi:hypothetical protein